ncbi:asparagine synthetase B family protein [Chitinophaga rhizophila]|uniref:asparagine synthase (glutamine-hydrolyzing) n=1 Tax=Chitinophaga rhizophila TaxID=2866212 RepID=A0ABS7GLQ0_9BACT|nr:asparagine synthase-related protein [Chitinophaga rhizophila]MBW8687418.1 hypothetical protein [Chitinophaga rhizophila]
MTGIFGIIYKSGQPVTPAIDTTITHVFHQRQLTHGANWIDGHVLIGQWHPGALSTANHLAAPLITDGLVVAADVRIDNRMYILRQTGADPSATDKELLLGAYRKWGSSCLHHLEGEYAFCIWEQATRRLLLATDHVGFRPLYYYDAPDVFIFSSTLNAILTVKPLPHVFNADSLIAYHFRQGSPALTFTKDVYALCGGNYLRLENKTTSIKKYWQPAPGKYSFTSFNECATALREVMHTAIRNRIPASGKVGITLSGGLDSSAIAAILAKELAQQNRPLYAFSSVLPDNTAGKDERVYIDIMGEHYNNIIQMYVHASDGSPLDNTLNAFNYDETFPNAFHYMDHAILKAAQQEETGVLFTGYGGDHWVSWQGHPVIYNMLMKGRVKDVYTMIRSFVAKENLHPLQVMKREIAVHAALYRMWRGRQRKMVKNTALQPAFLQQYKSSLDFRPVRNIQTYMMENIVSGRTGQLPAVLAGRNRGYGISSAVPLLDRHILELMMDIPEQTFIHNGYKRSLLRHAMQELLPDKICWRRDKGMYAPDFLSRIKADIPRVKAEIAAADNTLPFNRYFSKAALQRLAGGDELAMIRMTQASICSTIIDRLQKNGYVFEDKFS